MTPGGDDLAVQPHRHDGAIVVRVWTEADDPRVRARVLTTDGDEDDDDGGEPAIGTASILAIVARLLADFELRAPTGAEPDGDDARK